MKKLSNRLSVKQSSTKEGQRELIREHTNKINEIIEALEKNPRLVYVVEEKPYTAMRSTGEQEYCVCKKPREYSPAGKSKYCFNCNKYIKPQDDVREKLADIIIYVRNGEYIKPQESAYDIADRILAIVKGE